MALFDDLLSGSAGSLLGSVGVGSIFDGLTLNAGDLLGSTPALFGGLGGSFLDGLFSNFGWADAALLGGLGLSAYFGLDAASNQDQALSNQENIIAQQGALAAEQLLLARDAFNLDKELSLEQLELFKEMFATSRDLNNEQLEIMRDVLQQQMGLTDRQVQVMEEAFLNNKALTNEQQQMLREAFLSNQQMSSEQFNMARNAYLDNLDLSEENRQLFQSAYDRQQGWIDQGINRELRNSWLAEDARARELANQFMASGWLTDMSEAMDAAYDAMGAFGQNRFNTQDIDTEFRERLAYMTPEYERTMDRMTSEGVAGLLRTSGGASITGQEQELGRALMAEEARLRDSMWGKAKSDALAYISGRQDEIYKGEEFDTIQRAKRMAEIAGMYQPRLQGAASLPGVSSGAYSFNPSYVPDPMSYRNISASPVPAGFPGQIGAASPGGVSAPNFYIPNAASWQPSGLANPGYPGGMGAANYFGGANSALSGASQGAASLANTLGANAAGWGNMFGGLLSDLTKSNWFS